MPLTRTLWNRSIEARDGTSLAADVFMPAGEGPFPVVVLRTPYARSRTLENPKSWIRLVDDGYVLVTVDQRGRNDSGGEFVPWTKDTQDGHAVIEWVAEKSWCSGKIGMVGGSYNGLAQWWSVLGRPPQLACIAPLCSGCLRQAVPYKGGVPVQYWLWWMNIVRGKTYQYTGAPNWDAFMDHTPLTSLDARLGLARSAWSNYVAGDINAGAEAGALCEDDLAQIDIPVLIGVGWWDDQEAMSMWQALQRAKSARECRLLIGAWDHAGNTAPRPMLGGMDVSASMMDTIGYIERFLSKHLKNDASARSEMARCRVFLTGTNRWDDLDHWPEVGAIETSLYLTSDGDARGLAGSGRLIHDSQGSHGSDSYRYDPRHPPRDMSSLADFGWAEPPLDQRYLQRRVDCLVYSTAPLAQPMQVSGRYQLHAFVSSDRPDTDILVSLCDVHPDGRAVGLAATNEMPPCIRLSYRDGPTRDLLVPGQVYSITIEGSWIHHVFEAGHCIRITVSSGIFPLMARNAGTGYHWAVDSELHPQRNVLYHGANFPSRLLLPVVQRPAN